MFIVYRANTQIRPLNTDFPRPGLLQGCQGLTATGKTDFRFTMQADKIRAAVGGANASPPRSPLSPHIDR